jgi:hypothetical protein
MDKRGQDMSLRQRDRETERQRERQRDRETERETERQRRSAMPSRHSEPRSRSIDNCGDWLASYHDRLIRPDLSLAAARPLSLQPALSNRILLEVDSLESKF